MKYKKYKCNSFNVHTIKTDRFKTSHMEIIFRKNCVKEELCAESLLVDILNESCKKYPKRKDLVARFEELYEMGMYGQTVRTGNILCTNFNIDFINPEFINDSNYLENVLKMPFLILQEPCVVNEEFDLKLFNLMKERLRREIVALKENPAKESIRGALNMLDSSSPTTYELLGTLEDLEKITPSSLYKQYKKLYKENVCDIFIIGNLDMDEVVTIIKKYFKNRFINELDLKIEVENKVVKKPNIGGKLSENIQSNLVLLFNLVDLDKKERDVTFQVFNYLFGSGGLSSKLYQSLREKNSLCYGVSSIYLKNDSLLLVQVSLENKNVKKAIDLIKKDLKAMNAGKFDEKNLSDAIKNMIVSLDLSSDNNIAILNNYVFHEFADLPLIEERKEMYKTVTKAEVIRVSKKVKLNTIYNLKGKEA